MNERPEYVLSGERARLIPAGSDTGKEVRALSILLATLSSVPPFASTMLDLLGQRTGVRSRLDCFTEVCLSKDGDPKVRPDGLLVVDGGRGRQWHCLVEAKIGRAQLEAEQVTKYINLARNNGVPALLTISNQFAATPTHIPVKLPKHATRGVSAFHWSWMSILTHAMLLLNEHDFERPEQRFILSEMVRYFSHPGVAVSSFDRMNPEWKELTAKVQSGARLSKAASEVEKSVAAWHQECRDLSLLMSRKLGRRVQLKLARAHADDQILRLRTECEALTTTHKLRCTLDIPDAAAPLHIVADLQRRCVSISMSLVAPSDKQRASSRINWLLRQLAKAEPDEIHVRASWPGRAPDTQASLAELRHNPALLLADSRTSAPSKFEVLLIRDLAGKFGGTRTFVELLEDAVPRFYEQAGEKLRAYVPPPPTLKRSANAAAAGEVTAAAEQDVDHVTRTAVE